MLSFLIPIILTLPQALGPSPAEMAAIESGLALETDGVEVIEVGSGIAVVACATAYYTTDQSNQALALQGQRYACLEASLGAQSSILNYFEGLTLESATELKSKFSSEDSLDSSEVSAEFSAAEGGSQLAVGVLKGVVVYEVDDRPEEGAVSIWVVSSPNTRLSVRRTSSRSVSFEDYQAGTDYIMEQALRGTVPPTGGTLIRVPATGEVAWIGYGSALVHPSGNRATGRLAGRAKEAAIHTSKQLANSALLDCIQGKPIAMEGELSLKYENFEKSVESFVGGMNAYEATAASTMLDERQLTTAQAGRLPSGVIHKSFTTDDGNWSYTFAILRGVHAVKEPTSSKTGEGRSGSSPAVEPCSMGSERGVNSVLVRMSGASRKEALSAALLEAVQRTNGLQLESSLSLQSRFASADAYLNGEALSMAVAGVSVDEDVSTHTAGLIDSYTVLSEGPVTGGYEVEVCARVPSFEPSWRPGGKQVVAVLPFVTNADEFFVNGALFPASDYTRDMEAVLVDALLATGDFYVIDRRNSRVVEDVLDDIRSGVSSGKMQVSEIGKVGQLKGIDLLITGSLDTLEHRNYGLYIDALKREEPRTILGVLSQCRITSVTDGTVLGQSFFSKAWGGDTQEQMGGLQEFLSHWPGYQPAHAAFRAAARDHLQEISQVAKALRNWSRLEVIEYLDDGVVLLEAFRVEFAEELSAGDPLQVKWRKVARNGKEFLLDRCMIEVVEVQEAGLVVARVLEKSGGAPPNHPVPGDFAQVVDG